MTRAKVVLAFALVLALGACGDEDFGASDATEALAPVVAHVRATAEAHDPTAARHALDELRASVESLVADGHIDRDESDRLLAAAAQVEERLVLITPATTVPPPTTTTAAPPPPDPKPQDRGKNKKDDDDD